MWIEGEEHHHIEGAALVKRPERPDPVRVGVLAIDVTSRMWGEQQHPLF